MKIICGAAADGDEVTMDDVSRIVTQEICEEADPVDSVPPILMQSNQYP